MKKLIFFVLILTVFFCSKDSFAQPVKDIAKYYEIVSVPYSVPDNDELHFSDIAFKFGWNDKAPYTIAIQFINHGYSSRKLKFAIKDVTSNKTIILDTIHNSRFGSELLKANATSNIWSGVVDNVKDSFSLHVWDSDGDEFDKVPISIKDQQ
jgi:hypothetical protein